MIRLFGISMISLVLTGPSVLRANEYDDAIAILERKCLSCHDASSAKGKFVLETRETALAHKKAIVPNSPGASQLIELVSGTAPEMPKKGTSLTTEEVDILRKWIASNAPWPDGRILVDNPERDLDWWSLKPIEPIPISVSSPNPVDHFIESKLNERQLTPVGQAKPLTLIRRLTYDLTGLPPTPEEIDHFLKATKTDPEAAWLTLTDRLLESSAFGEKFAQHWLDIARYGESHGYDKDKPRSNAWPYRDYVIRSFNDDKPFPKFVQEQIAGDILFPENPDGILGLGFLAAGPWDFISHWEVGEGKLDGRIAKHLDRDEIVSAVFNVFQSTTVQCAQCHHHKFDPVRMEDYYRLHAVFAAVDRADRVYEGLSQAQQKEKTSLLTKANILRKEQEQIDTKFKQLLAGEVSGMDRRIAELKEKYGSGLKPQYGYHSQITKNQNEEKWVQVDLGRSRNATEVRLIPAYDQYNGIGAGFGFPIRYRVEVANDAEFRIEPRVLLDASREDQPNPRTRTVTTEGDGRPFRYLRVTATKLRDRNNDFIFALGELEIVNEGGAINFAEGVRVTALDSIESGIRWGTKNLVDGIFFRELTNETALTELQTLQEKRAAIEKKLRTPESVARLDAIKNELAKLDTQIKTFPKGQQVYAAATHFNRGGKFTPTEGVPRPIHLLHRGDLRSPKAEMTPGAPPLWSEVTGMFPSESEGDARAQLARYLTRKDNPLLWRSIANRLWQWTFSQPLVETANDFGRGGMPPTHPELLDFLAAQLRDDPKHSIKSIIRLLATSKTYRRASNNHQDNALIDGGNTYLWRAHRRRLTAEEFRDSLLTISGIMDRKMGGPSFRDFVLEKPQHSPHYEYHLHDPNDPASHRRTIYRFIARSQPHPMLTTLDCADPSMSVASRDESTTALQALTQWNHRFVEAMSTHFAKRLNNESSPERQIDLACRLALGRPPHHAEYELLLDHLTSHGPESFARVMFNLNAFVYVD